MSLCLLDEDSFRSSCKLLLQQSEELRDSWTWEPVQGSSEEGYLKKIALKSVVIDSSLKWNLIESDTGEEQTPPDCLNSDTGYSDDEGEAADVCGLSEGSSSSQVFQYEYHIVYSCSYRTPALYFRACTLEGRSLSLEEVWSSVHPNLRLRLKHCPLNTITQQEHPLLGQPFFLLHPCRTQDFMRPVLQAAHQQNRSVNYVLTWLSVVGPLVGLDVPLHYSISSSSTKPD
ncbi:ubiquitin-like-conjugating enzyme ATG10 isoform X1 [Sphaeramia orbicularis]|uniref:ubiquitin-like-conjugating enzyme ATG10 isoform X1 n=1 Tax=Sphaeramia orbicularis TaxID=375764 RepID=UPI00117D7D37|nr:ubiquitin-like-conjugating enzyme ATG10 isoform X1 [Sphaeramia orbicularis]